MFENLVFHHIGIATDSILNTSEYYLESGYEVGEIFFDPIQNVKVCFINKSNRPQIELVEPVNENSPVWNIINKSGVGPYHICYVSDEIHEDIMKLKQKKFIPLSKPVPAAAFNDRLICFIYNREVGLIELLQKES